LSHPERERVALVLCSQRFVDRSPAEVFATLLDEKEYLCSERTMYRVLAECRPVRERRNQLQHPKYAKPELMATAPNQVWSWDITKLLGPKKWTYYTGLYLCGGGTHPGGGVSGAPARNCAKVVTKERKRIGR
jgi:putative transposase